MNRTPMTVPVEQVQAGDVITTPRGRRLVVERVDRYDQVLNTRGVELQGVRHVIRTRPWGSLVPRAPGTPVPIERPKETP